MENKIRVLHILDELNTGGAETIVSNYFKYVDKEQFQWDFVITRRENQNERGALENFIEENGGVIYRIPRKRENYLANIMAVYKILDHNDYDIVHSHLDELSTFYLLSAMIKRVPVRICHSHLAGADRGKNVELLCKFLKPIMKFVVTDKFSCGIEAGKALWGSNAIKSNEVYVMNNAIEINKFVYDEKIALKKKKELNVYGKKILGSVGRLTYQKNSEFIVEIFSEYHKMNPDSVLMLIGVGEREKNVKKLVDSLKLGDSIFFLGARNDVNELMMMMDYFILPSRFEGLPIVMIEAQCTGLTCFISDKITKEVYINRNVIYKSISDSPYSWAEQIFQYTDDFDRKAGKKAIIENGYDILTESKKLQSYYIDLIKDHRRNK